MLPIRKEIVQYADELEETINYIKETNDIANLVHRCGNWSNGNNVLLNIDNYEVFSVSSFDDTFLMYLSNYDSNSSVSDYKIQNGCSLVKYKSHSQEINFAGTIYTIEDAFSNFEEITFQQSTFIHQCALDGFELILLLTERGLDCTFLLTTPMDLDTITGFNKNYDKMMQDSYERFGRYRA